MGVAVGGPWQCLVGAEDVCEPGLGALGDILTSRSKVGTDAFDHHDRSARRPMLFIY